jgi:hypothetical protein
VKVTLYPGESYVIFNKETWDYLITVFLELSRQDGLSQEEIQGWRDLAEDVTTQVYETLNETVFDEEIDEWQ